MKRSQSASNLGANKQTGRRAEAGKEKIFDTVLNQVFDGMDPEVMEKMWNLDVGALDFGELLMQAQSQQFRGAQAKEPRPVRKGK